jgi:hypothetical protein
LIAARVLTLLTLLSGLSLLAPNGFGAEKWLDRSHAIFLPPEVREKLDATQTFPLFWWNFLVLDGAADHPEKVQAICRAFRDAPDSPLEKIPCGGDLHAFLPLLRDWARDTPLRRPFPGRNALRREFRATYAEATLPMGGELLPIFREDPLSSTTVLRRIFESQVKMDLPRRGGLFVDPRSKRVVVPVQFKSPPADTAATARFYRILAEACPRGAACPAMTLIGPHASTAANEGQVQKDVERVSLVGILLTAAQILFLLLSRRARALWLFPPVLLATGIAAAATVAIFGSIHGLTLAFGTGLIGLAIDYGLHSAFNVSYRGVWRANLCGIVTTIAGLAVMLSSEVPLLRQLMTFAIIGLAVAYLLFYFLHARYGSFFAIAAFPYEPRITRARTITVLAILAAAIPAALVLRPNLDMRQFDFQSPREIEVRDWIYPHLGVKTSLLDLDPATDFDAALRNAHTKQAWADANGIGFQSIARFVPARADSDKNRATWERAFCPDENRAPRSGPLAGISEDERKFFASAIARLDCSAIRRLGRRPSHSLDRGPDGALPSYLRDFRGGGAGFLAVWLPRDAAQTEKVKSAYPDALSLREIVDIFPKTLSAELRWMSPLSILLASLFLFLYYRKLSRTLLALVPFFCATGVYAIGVFLFDLPFSFISLIALLMIFGFSIDYGVFAVDVTLEPEGRSVTGVWTCLLFASVATGLGFVPLLLCRHPVLAHLGQTLTLGTLGTAIGTLWGIPGIARLTRMTSPEKPGRKE